jgi:uncharacterized alkaline shock family protein YloU
MSDTKSGEQASNKSQSGSSGSGRSSGSGTVAQLQSEQGTTSVADGVVAKIARLAAEEVEGVAELGGSVQGAIGNVVGRIRGSEHRTSGVGVEVGERQAAVDITLKVTYPASIHEVADSVRQNVIDRIQSMTGLEVVEVNLAVIDLVFPGEETEAPPQPQSASTGRVQ